MRDLRAGGAWMRVRNAGHPGGRNRYDRRKGDSRGRAHLKINFQSLLQESGFHDCVI